MHNSPLNDITNLCLSLAVCTAQLGFLGLSAYLAVRNWKLEARDNRVLDAVWDHRMPAVPLVDKLLTVVGTREERKQDAADQAQGEAANTGPPPTNNP